MSIRQIVACHRLSSLGIKQAKVHEILDLVSKWERDNGIEWTIARLKQLKQLVINRVAQVTGSDADLLHSNPTWVRLRNGLPVGPFGALMKDLSTPRKLGRALNAIMVYSSYESDTVTAKQWKKFQSSVENPPSSTIRESDYWEGVKTLPDMDYKSMRFRQVTDVSWSNNRRAPGYGRSYPETDVSSWLRDFFEVAVNRKHWNTQQFRGMYDSVLGRITELPWTKALPRSIMEGKDEWDTVGNISFIQEPGFKLRAVANPHRVHQLVLEPLKLNLMQYLKLLPEDCCHNQETGVVKVQGWLKMGHCVSSVDLSDATNVFPLAVQARILEVLCVPKSQMDLFISLSKAAWSVKDPTTGQVRRMQWSKGQPLGLGPSFAAFSIAHHVIARASCSNYDGNNYVLLGDDICFRERADAQRYMELLKKLGCPYSKEKTLVSNTTAEFAGKLITKETVISSIKWRSLSDRNFIENCKFYGPQFIGALRKRQRSVAKLISELPEWHGGLGWNPKGKPLVQRLQENIDLINLQEESAILQVANNLPLDQRIDLGLVPRPKINMSLFGETVGKASETPSRPVRRVESEKQIVKDIKPHTLRSEHRHEGYVPVSPETSDPRGKPTLEVWEQKLGIQPTVRKPRRPK